MGIRSLIGARGLALGLALGLAGVAFASQSTVVMPVTGPRTMADVMGTLNSALMSLLSNNSGTTAPATGTGAAPIAYQWWADTSAQPRPLKIYTGSTWVTAGTLNTSTNIWASTIADGSVLYAGLGSAAVATAAEYQAATASKVLTAANVWTAAEPVALTDGATITANLAAGVNFSLTKASSGSTLTLSNPKAGQSGYIRILQDGTGSRTITVFTNGKWAGGTAGTLTTTANRIDYLYYTVHGSTEIVYSLIKDVR